MRRGSDRHSDSVRSDHSSGRSPPSNTAQSLANLARDPGQNVDGIYALTLLSDLYAPPLVTMPDAWTVTVKINDSGNDEPDFLISGPGNLAFDKRGYAWVTNNTTQGSPNSCTFNLVFKPNGQPADGSNGTPRSPLTGGGILGAGFGVTIDPHGSVWFGNFGWGNPNCDWCFPTPNGNGSMSRFTLTGMPVSPPDAYQGGPVRAQGIASDANGNIWISSYGNNSVYVFIHGNPHQSVCFRQYERKWSVRYRSCRRRNRLGLQQRWTPFGEYPRSVAKYTLVNGVLEQRFLRFLGEQLRGLSVDSQGNAWVASQGDSWVYAIRPDGTEIGSF